MIESVELNELYMDGIKKREIYLIIRVDNFNYSKNE